MREVDPEIKLLEQAYDALRGMDFEAQMRSIHWLSSRLQYEHAQLELAGTSASEPLSKLDKAPTSPPKIEAIADDERNPEDLEPRFQPRISASEPVKP